MRKLFASVTAFVAENFLTRFTEAAYEDGIKFGLALKKRLILWDIEAVHKNKTHSESGVCDFCQVIALIKGEQPVGNTDKLGENK